ncbi:hypothetical protein Q5752_006597 [Cryptotrichosporon argae]
MARFLLGTGSGIAAAAAVYYTLSSNLEATTEGLRADLHSATSLLASSLSPVPPPAASASVGPAYPYSPPFSQLVRTRWNHAVSSALAAVRETDWAAAAASAYVAGQQVVGKLAGDAEGATRDAKVGDGAHVPGTSRRVEEKIEGLTPVVEVMRKAEAAPKRLV